MFLRRYWFLSFFILFGIILIIISMGCLGKTIAKQAYFISPKKKTAFIAPPVNYTDYYLLDDQIRNQVKNFFSSQYRFAVVENVEDSDIYILIHIYNYQISDVNDYGFGNREVEINTGLFVSDARFYERSQKDEKSRYYYKDYRLNVEMRGYVESGNYDFTEKNLVHKAIERLAFSIHELLLTGNLPSTP